MFYKTIYYCRLSSTKNVRMGIFIMYSYTEVMHKALTKYMIMNL